MRYESPATWITFHYTASPRRTSPDIPAYTPLSCLTTATVDRDMSTDLSMPVEIDWSPGPPYCFTLESLAAISILYYLSDHLPGAIFANQLGSFFANLQPDQT